MRTLRRNAKPRPAKPSSIIAQVADLGTADETLRGRVSAFLCHQRHCLPVRLWPGGCSFKFGRISMCRPRAWRRKGEGDSVKPRFSDVQSIRGAHNAPGTGFFLYDSNGRPLEGLEYRGVVHAARSLGRRFGNQRYLRLQAACAAMARQSQLPDVQSRWAKIADAARSGFLLWSGFLLI